MSTTPEPCDPAKAADMAAMLPLSDTAGSYWLLEWLTHCKDPFVWCAVKILQAVSWAVDRFTNRQITLIKAEAEAEKTRAEADKIKAEAEATRIAAAANAVVVKAKGLAEAKGLEIAAQVKKAKVSRKKKGARKPR